MAGSMSEMFNKDKPNFVGIGFVLILLSNMFYPEFIMQAMAAWLLYLLTAIFFHVVFVFIDDWFSMKTLEDGQPIFITYKNKTVPIYWYAIVDAINFILWLALSLLNFSFILRIVENMDYAIGCCILIVILLSGLTNLVKFFFKKFKPTYDVQDGETYDVPELLLQKYTQLNQAFIYVVSVGNIEAVKHTLKLGANINSKHSNGVPALILSIRNEHYDVTKFLIENGADVNLTDNDRATAINVAAIKGQIEIVKLLIGNGADIDAMDLLGNTPLLAAKIAKKNDICNLLLSRGASTDIKNYFNLNLIYLINKLKI